MCSLEATGIYSLDVANKFLRAFLQARLGSRRPKMRTALSPKRESILTFLMGNIQGAARLCLGYSHSATWPGQGVVAWETRVSASSTPYRAK